MTSVRVLERVTRHAPIGLRFRDTATGQIINSDLIVTITSRHNRLRSVTCAVNGSGVWYAQRFPGISDTPEPAGSPPDDGFWAQPRMACRVSVNDQAGRFLPLSVDMDFPVKGLANWPGWAALPPGPLAALTDDDGSSPPNPVISRDALPLFSAAGRSSPAPLAEIRCQLAYADTEAPAAWALVTASHAGRVRAIAQADEKGRAVLFFPYPERPRASLAASPPAITDFRWSIALAAYADRLDPARPPELTALMGQLNSAPRDLFASTESPLELLPSQLLSFGRPLTLRTSQTPSGPSSHLLIAP